MEFLKLGIVSAWIDFLFPPLCVFCKEFCRTTFLCPLCWDLCTPLDPEHRCLHCFADSENTLCSQCQKEPYLAVPYASVFEPTGPAKRLCLERKERPEAIAAFMMYQWARLKWPMPQAIVPFTGAESLAKSLALWLDIPHISLLKPYSEHWECDSELIEEDQIILLIDLNSPFFQLQKAVAALSEAFPKRIYILSLIDLLRN